MSSCFVSSTILSLPKCGKGKPALVRRNTVDDKSELIACIETGNFAKAARIAAGKLVALRVMTKICTEAGGLTPYNTEKKENSKYEKTVHLKQ